MVPALEFDVGASVTFPVVAAIAREATKAATRAVATTVLTRGLDGFAFRPLLK